MEEGITRTKRSKRKEIHSKGIKNLPPVTMVLHGIGDLGETGDIATGHERRQIAFSGGVILLSRLNTLLESGIHNLLKTTIDFLRRPAEPGRVLRHLKPRHGNTAGVSSLTGAVPDGLAALVSATVGLEDIDGGLGAAHVGALGDELAAGVDERLGFLARDLVLRGAGQGDVDGADVYPWAGTGDVLGLVAEGFRGGQAGELLALSLEVGDQVDFVRSEVVLLGGGDEGAGAVGEGDDGSAELDGFEGCVLGDVAGAGEGDALAGEGLGALADELNHVVDVLFAR